MVVYESTTVVYESTMVVYESTMVVSLYVAKLSTICVVVFVGQLIDSLYGITRCAFNTCRVYQVLQFIILC